jgi:DNA-binding NtrC family response regulator
MATSPETAEAPTTEVTPWVLVVLKDHGARHSAREAWELAGFAVEFASDATDALECLKVMTPSIVVIDGRMYRPGPR